MAILYQIYSCVCFDLIFAQHLPAALLSHLSFLRFLSQALHFTKCLNFLKFLLNTRNTRKNTIANVCTMWKNISVYRRNGGRRN